MRLRCSPSPGTPVSACRRGHATPTVVVVVVVVVVAVVVLLTAVVLVTAVVLLLQLLLLLPLLVMVVVTRQRVFILLTWCPSPGTRCWGRGCCSTTWGSWRAC